MCMSKKLCAAFHVIWSLVYIVTGTVQLVAGLFFLFTLPISKVGSNIWTGAWNVVIGIGGTILSCVGELTPKKQEILLYLTISILAINVVNIVLLEIGEWYFFMTDNIKELISQRNLKNLVFYAHIITSISTVVAIVTSFLDSQFTFCSMQRIQEPKKNLHEQVSDIEYIIPRKKSSSVAKQAQNIYSQYAQSWVFDSDTAGSSKNESPYLKIPNMQHMDGNKTFIVNNHKTADGEVCSDSADKKMFVVNPVVHVEQVSDGSNGSRSLNYMKSFSRTPSPGAVSESSSQDSSTNNPPIYECLERLTEPTIYRSRLNTAISLNVESSGAIRSPTASRGLSIRPRSETFTNTSLVIADGIDINEKVQYASLMVELQQAFLSKKEKFQQSTSPQSACDSVTVEDSSDKTISESKASSCQESLQDDSQRTEQKGSDTEFSKELEAALQLIQDLESPNTIETPSETCRSIDEVEVVLPSSSTPMICVKWKESDSSESSKTLSACISPVEELPEEVSSTSQGKRTSVVVVAPAESGSQSSSGYSSPTPGNSKRPTPLGSKPSSVSGSAINLAGENLSYAISNKGSAAIISLFSPSAQNSISEPMTSIAGVQIPNEIPSSSHKSTSSDTVEVINNNFAEQFAKCNGQQQKILIEDGSETIKVSNNSKVSNDQKLNNHVQQSPQSTISSSSSSRWNVKSLLRRKSAVPTLAPELEGAIFKSESLAYLTELELLARHARNKSIQRQIEQRVQQQILGVYASESHC